MYPKPSSREKRMFNWIIDSIIVFIISLGFSLLAIFLLQIFDFKKIMSYENVIFPAVYFLYYFIFESLFKRTIGKLLTKTKVVHLNDISQRVTIGQILLRSVIRLIPIEFLSYFSEDPVGWHDNASNTIVINIKELKGK
jgi:uncharacterized RDD family membrane protein YckC